ncbi:MAG TPA: FecR domain-containing protein [Pyrinomonadaceae bacterium]|nr:FecR domain-containing protein [Pyrinomonadaceae bacterium]
MKRRLFGFVGLLVLATINVAAVFGQNQTLRSAVGDKYIISAKAGGVNYVEGTVGVAKLSGKGGLLLKGDTLEVGDRVSTNKDGRAEILLNPGSYLRLAENSTFEFQTTSLEDLQLKLDRGSAILEVFAGDDFKVSVKSPKEEFNLVQTGIYRIDVSADGSGRIEVWKGKAEVGDSVLKGGKAGVSADGQVAVAKFDRDDRDVFETWSKERGKELAKATNSLKDRELRTSLMRSFLGGRWNMYDSFGLWVYSSQLGRNCFLPFGYGWSSPYGYGFGTDIWWYRLPSAVYYPPTNRPPVGNPPGDRRPRPPVGKRETPPSVAKRATPPFAAIQGGSPTGPKYGRGVEPSGNDGGFGRSPGYSPGPVFAPPSSKSASPPPPSAPGPVRGIGGMKRVN